MYHVTTILGKGCGEPRYVHLHQLRSHTSPSDHDRDNGTYSDSDCEKDSETADYNDGDSTSDYKSGIGTDLDSDGESDNEKDGDCNSNISEHNSSSSIWRSTSDTRARHNHSTAPLQAGANVRHRSSISNTPCVAGNNAAAGCNAVMPSVPSQPHLRINNKGGAFTSNVLVTQVSLRSTWITPALSVPPLNFTLEDTAPEATVPQYRI